MHATLGFIRCSALRPTPVANQRDVPCAEVEDVSLDSRTVTLREKKRSKNSLTTRVVPLNDSLASVLREWLNVHPGGSHLFCKPRARPGKIPTPYPNRIEQRPRIISAPRWPGASGRSCTAGTFSGHSFASNLARSGKVIQAYIDALMGHLTAGMRERYRHLFPDNIRMAAAVLAELDVAR